MPALSRPLLIGIDGRSGAGKTQFTRGLHHQLQQRGHAVVVFSLDEIYPGWDGLRAGVKHYSDAILPQLAAGTTVEFRRWDWYARGPEAGPDGAPGPLVSLPSGEVVLCEGVGATATAARRWLDLSIWLEAPEPLRQRRALERDGDTYRGHWRRWADQEERLFHDHSEHDVVVNSTTTDETMAPRLVRRIEELLER